MAIVVEGSASTNEQAAGSSNTYNVPTGVTAGELLALFYCATEPNRDLVAPVGWDGAFSASNTYARVGVVWKIAEGTESGTQVFSFSSGTSGSGGIMVRFSGVDTEDPFNTLNWVEGEAGSSIDPWTLSAETLTGVDSGSLIVTNFGTDAANRDVSSLDSDLTLIQSVTGGATGFSFHCAYEEPAGSGNSAYSCDMSDSRDYWHMLVEVKSAAAAPSNNSLTYDLYYSTFLSSGN